MTPEAFLSLLRRALFGAPSINAGPQGRRMGRAMTNDKKWSGVPSLEDQMEAYLKARGLTLTDAKQAGLSTIDPDMAKRMRFPYPGDGIVIPYFHPLTNEPLETVRRLRLFEPANDKDGKEIRFIQPKGTSVEVYFPRRKDWRRIAKDTRRAIDIVEGEIKGLALA